ncbi:MAG: ATP-binding protein [Gordonibacter sp.]
MKDVSVDANDIDAVTDILCERLRSMRMSAMAEALEGQLDDPNADLRGFFERLTEIIDAEWQSRYDKKFTRFLKNATLRYPSADFDETIYDPDRLLDAAAIEQLAKCEWVDEGKNLLITGPTSGGKSYLANAMCVAALRQFKTVRYVKASRLMGELEKAREESSYIDYLAKSAKLDLLVIDDFGFMDLDLDKCRDLFEVIDIRDGRRALIVISQVPVSEWFNMFANATYAEACLARMTDKRRTYRLEMKGKSMRDCLDNHAE